MVNPQKENGFTAIANEIMEVVARTPLDGRDFRVLLFVLRKTYGFQKKEDRISLSQFQEGTAIDRSSICKILRKLVAYNLLERGSRKGVYKFNKKWDKWLISPKTLVAYKPIGSGVQDNLPSGVEATYKRKDTKENKTKERSYLVDKSTSSSFSRIDRGIEPLGEILKRRV